MARLARLSIGGYPHLVAQRAGARAVVSDDDDANHLLGVLRAAMVEADVGLHGYALLPRGIWLLATPADAHGLGRAMQSIGRRYVRWVNDRRREKGALFDGRYRAALLEPEAELLSALRYIESQPVLAGLAAVPEESRWSSCRHHVGLATDPGMSDHPVYWALGNTPYERQAAYRISCNTEFRTTKPFGLSEHLLAVGCSVQGHSYARLHPCVRAARSERRLAGHVQTEDPPYPR